MNSLSTMAFVQKQETISRKFANAGSRYCGGEDITSNGRLVEGIDYLPVVEILIIHHQSEPHVPFSSYFTVQRFKDK